MISDTTKILAAAGGILVLLILVALMPFTMIGAGERGVVLKWGAVQPLVLNEGFHWITPVADSVAKMDVKTVKREVKSSAYSKDLQTVETTVALNFHANPDTVNQLYQKIGVDYAERIIDPAIQESIKSSTANFTAQELVEQRAKVKDDIRIQLLNRLKDNFITVDDFSIVNLDFSDTFERSIEAKQVAQQDALKAENDLKRVQFEADQRVAQAKAEAEAIKIQAEAIPQQGGKDYVQLQAILKWDGILPNQMIPGSTVPFINLNN